jgi:hypothetical protein
VDDVKTAQVIIGRLSPAERARRKAAVDYGRGSVRLEGFVLGEDVEELNRRYIDGEMTRPELTKAILRLNGL